MSTERETESCKVFVGFVLTLYRDFKSWADLQGEPLTGREAVAPSVIRRVEKVQGGEQAPRNGSLALPKYVVVQPFSLKGLLNTKLSVLLSLMARGSNGRPGGHVDLSGGLLGLHQHSLEGVLVVEMPTTSF